MKNKSIFMLSSFLALILLVSCHKKDEYKPNSGKKPPVEKLELTYRLSEPSTVFDRETPDTLDIYFSGSAAKLEDVGKEPSGTISITPEIKGKWKWESDSELSFQPEENWKLDTKYKITMNQNIFADNVTAKGDSSFTTPEFKVYLDDTNFAVDPENPNIKKVYATVRASNSMQKEDFEKQISLTLEARGTKNRVTSDVKFSVSFNKYATEAYIESENIPMPPKTSSLTVTLKSGVKCADGSTVSKHSDKETVQIPGLSDYVQIRNISHSLVKNNDNNYDQVLFIETKGDISVNDLQKHLTIYLLPKDKPEEQGWRAVENYRWSGSRDEITELVLSKSTKVEYEAIQTEAPFASMNSFKFKAPTHRFLYVQLSGGIVFHGGYRLDEETTEVLRVQDYPKELGILSEGTILSLSGSNKMAMYSRGVNEVTYTLSRIMPKDINHLVSMSNGSMKNFSFNNYNFNENNIAESKTIKNTIYNASEEEISYFSYDFSNDLKPNAAKHLSNGLFIFRVSGGGMSDKRFILVTDLGFFIKRNTDGTRDVFVQSISTGLPVPNATVSIIGLNGNELVSLRTDGKGHTILPYLSSDSYSAEHKPTAYVVKTENDLSFMPYSESGRRLDYSNFDVGGIYGKSDPNTLTGVLFSDRGMYRPGDSINLGLIVKAGDWNIDISNITFECTVTDSKSNTILTKQFQLDSSGFAEINFATQDYSPTGVYTASVYRLMQHKDYISRDYLTGTQVKVEEFLPDTLKIATNFDPLPNAGWINPGDIKGTVSLKNLFGTPAAGNEIKAQMTLTPGFPNLRRYSNYSFSDPYYRGKSFEEFLGTQTTDENGEASFNLDTQKFEKATYCLDFYAEGYVKGGGRSVSQNARTYVSPLKYIIGFKADGSLSYISRNSVRKISLLAIDQNLERTNVKNVTLQVEEIKYISTLVKQYNGQYKYQSVKKSYPLVSTKIDITKDGYDYLLPTENGGEYKVSIIDDSELVFNSFTYSVAGTQNVTRSLSRTAELELRLESSDLKAGGTAKIFIKAPYAGAGLITVERDKVYTSKWFTTKNLSTEQTIEIPYGMEGNGYINVMFTRAANSDEIFMSPFCYGAVPFSIDKENRTNKINLNVPEEIKSGTDLKIKYSSSDKGKIVVYAVDEGILQVAGYSMPNPLAEFFKKRALEVSTTQILDLVLPEYEILKTMSATGGGAGMDELSRNLNPFKRKQNKPVVYWSGIVDTDSSERELTYHVPDYFNGTLRVMAIAVSNRTIGAVQSSTKATNTFIISPNTPLAAAPDDEFDVSVTVTNNHKGSGENTPVTLNVTTSKHLELMGNRSIPLKISEGKDSTVTLRFKAKKELGGAEITFTAKDASESSKYTSTLSVRPSMPYQIWITSGSTTKKEVSVDVNHKTYDEFAKRNLSVANIPASFMDGLNFYLANYPYGCAEQVTSKAYPYLYDDFVKAGGKTHKDAEAMVSSTISILQSRKKSDGNIGYWTNASRTDPFITLYVAEFLTDARNRNFYVPSSFYSDVISAVKKYASSAEDDSYSVFLRSYAIYVLTKAEIITTSYIEKLENDISRKNFTPTDYEGLYLAASYAMLKQDKKADAILGKISRKKKFDSSWAYHNSLNYISTYIDVIATYFPARTKDITIAEIDELCSFLSNSYYNTLSTSAAIRAFESWAYSSNSDTYKVFEVAGKNTTPVTISGSPVLTADFSSSAEKIKFTSDKTMPMYYQTVVAGYETNLPEKSIKDGIEITREYCNLEGGKLSSVKVGDDVMVKISFRSLNGTVNNLALVDLQPAGLESDIESIRNFKDNKWSPDYVDIREDRVVIYASATEKIQTFTYKAKAICSGTFVVPPMFAESMYNKDIRALSPTTPLKIEALK
ncbi:MAG: alpha-2-macroglobulin [Treponema sp.]|nr:alpha-2-macroglobulin [Treponema sp.]